MSMWLLLMLAGCLGPSELPQPKDAPSLAPASWDDAEPAAPSLQTHAEGRIQRIDQGVRGFEMLDAEGNDWTATVRIDGRIVNGEEALAFEDLVVGMTVRAEGRIGNGQVLASAVEVLALPEEAEDESTEETTEPGTAPEVEETAPTATP